MVHLFYRSIEKIECENLGPSPSDLGPGDFHQATASDKVDGFETSILAAITGQKPRQIYSEGHEKGFQNRPHEAVLQPFQDS